MPQMLKKHAGQLDQFSKITTNLSIAFLTC